MKEASTHAHVLLMQAKVLAKSLHAWRAHHQKAKRVAVARFRAPALAGTARMKTALGAWHHEVQNAQLERALRRSRAFNGWAGFVSEKLNRRQKALRFRRVMLYRLLAQSFVAWIHIIKAGSRHFLAMLESSLLDTILFIDHELPMVPHLSCELTYCI